MKRTFNGVEVELPEQDVKSSGIYALACKVNGKVYVGQAVCFKNRWYENAYETAAICNAIKKHRWDNFSKIVLELVPREEGEKNKAYTSRLHEREEFWINKLKSHRSLGRGYNVAKAGPSNLGWKAPKDWCERNSAILKKIKADPEVRKHHGEMTRELLKTPEYREAVKKGIKKSWADPISREKRVNGIRKGKSTDAHRKKAAKIAKERWEQDPSIQEKIMEGNLRRWADPERRAATIKKMTEAQNRPEVKAATSKKSKESQNRPEVKAATSKKSKEMWADPEYRKKVLAGRKKAKALKKSLEKPVDVG